MIELSRHIESLMLKHDCVIVPNLGGFVTQYVPARRVDDEQLFLPPCRSVGFNPQLNLNDGLLVQSYMQAYDTNYPEALKLINDAVAQLKQQLQEEGEYELSGIGKLTLGAGGRYNFTPCEAGVLSPELYGLDAVTTPRIAELQKTTQQSESKTKSGKKKVNIKRTEKNYTISINRELVNYVAAAVVAIVFYFIFATPINNNEQTEQQVASTMYEQLFNKATASQQPANVQPTLTTTPIDATTSSGMDSAAVLSATQQKVEALQQAQNITTPQTTDATNTKANKVAEKEEATQPNVSGQYTLVLASAITEGNAQSFSEKLKKEGLNEATPYRRGRMVRVIYGHYPTEQAAQAALNKLQHNKAFAEAWIMEIK